MADTEELSSAAKVLVELALNRTKANHLDHHLICQSTRKQLDDTNAHVQTHTIPLDGNSIPTVPRLAEFLASLVVDYAIPRSRIERARAQDSAIGSSSNMTMLVREADRLFSRLSNSGELGELLLFALAERHIGAPQVLAKMSLKTDENLHYNGADGLFARVEGDVLQIYFGESKTYKKRDAGVYDCVQSIAPILKDSSSQSGPAARDQILLRSHIDVNNTETEQIIRSLLDPKNTHHNKIQKRACCLVVFDSNAYPSKPNTKKTAELHDEFENKRTNWNAHIKKRLTKEEIENFFIDFFLVPVPSVQDFRHEFFKLLGFSDEKISKLDENIEELESEAEAKIEKGELEK